MGWRQALVQRHLWPTRGAGRTHEGRWQHKSFPPSLLLLDKQPHGAGGVGSYMANNLSMAGAEDGMIPTPLVAGVGIQPWDTNQHTRAKCQGNKSGTERPRNVCRTYTQGSQNIKQHKHQQEAPMAPAAQVAQPAPGASTEPAGSCQSAVGGVEGTSCTPCRVRGFLRWATWTPPEAQGGPQPAKSRSSAETLASPRRRWSSLHTPDPPHLPEL